MKLAIAQLDPTVGDLSGNAQQILLAAQDAAGQGARLLLTPELSLCGYPPRDLLLRPGFIQQMATVVEQLAKDLPHGVAALVGLASPNPNAGSKGQKPLYNSMALLENGVIKAVFHKRLLPTYDVFDEDRYFESGTQTNHFYLGDADSSLHIGVTICEDLWNEDGFWGQRTYDVNPTAEVVAAGVDVVVNLSASPFTVGKQTVREQMITHAARQHNCPIVYVNQVGGNDDLIFDGCSVAMDRQGDLISRSPGFTPTVQLVEYSAEHRNLLPGSINPLLDTPEAEMWHALVLGVKDYSRKCGFSKAVVGLSGGIDSALVVAIATAALGPDNVLGVLMPSPYSSDHSISDAEKLAHNLGITTQTLAIGELMAGFDHTLLDLFSGTEPGVTEENLQSRIRGNLLMAIANKFGHLLLSTGNKSEMAVGYCTLYGDMNGGLAVIADVPKTKVYSLCDWLNSSLQTGASLGLIEAAGKTEIIPANILTKPPSAELRPDQVDQDSLPPYDILDDILERLIQYHQSAADIVTAGHDPNVVQRVIHLLTRAEFKRRQAPPVLKVTDRAFGMGWRMPIASRWPLAQ
ncbi:NAD+ synthase [Leptolyngbya cf. ectocarpi LEGE 11479]|uniref:Glutamine-dependent NAD(+) synthetase n=1 Tax=Leptolyngbya cf. ectocarpi LEGE 11479 TaxID=1828722 RepID=A0A928ZWA1_LEPEC|nr:NAD+ synthase [Leptolyngbya ectocarpi]MBE9068638.1 NAD+ synthase [Leptolyngbya cf. ectocarpi LEGE 11479]